jgi:midasin
LVVEAFEKRILVVFIIIDNRSSLTTSQQQPTTTELTGILNTKNVSFVNGKLVMRDYLDTFPFDFYVILNNVSALPETLSESLRQFFELSNNK